VLVLEGVDYEADVAVDGQVLVSLRGLCARTELDLSAYAGREVRLSLRLHPVPKSRPAPEDRVQANDSYKPAVSYSWDFHPRLVPLGFCQEPRLCLRGSARIEEADCTQSLSEDFLEAELLLEARLAAPGGIRLRWLLEEPGTGAVRLLSEVPAWQGRGTLAARIAAPRLWWPAGHGPQPLYRVRVELLDGKGVPHDSWDMRLGFRRSRLVMHPDQWSRPAPQDFPKPRTAPPITLEINGKCLFVKGANWVAPDIFYAGLGRAELEPLLRLAAGANMNLLRCWGGAPAMKDAFFEVADELGLMVWQEFTLACNKYPDTPGCLGTADRESRATIRRLRHHPCLVLWCGGNELFNSWSRMDDQSLVLRRFNANCLELDPHTPFLPTAPIEGMAHGHYTFRDMETGAEVWSLFQRAGFNAYTEFGVPSAANLEVLRATIPPEQLWPPKAGGIWTLRHAFGSWTPGHHLCVDVLEHYFGPSGSLEELVERSQWLQAEGLRGVYEEARRQVPRCSMALAWCLNEPWPTAANCSLVCWPARPKPALAAVAAACRPLLVSARIPRFQWAAQEQFSAELWLLNDSAAELPSLEVDALLVTEDGETLSLLTWTSPKGAPATNLQGPTAVLPLAGLQGGRFRLRLSVEGRPEMDSEYLLSLRGSLVEAAAMKGTPLTNV
jgi:beta-mannosidase